MSRDGQWSFLDALNVASFLIGLENLQENMTQSDKQDLMNDLSKSTDRLLSEIHAHLERQDEKINGIADKLEEIYADYRKDRRDD